MAYSKQTWSTGDPITQEKMNHIEDGIADAHSAASAATSDVSDLSSSIAFSFVIPTSPTFLLLRTILWNLNRE